VNQTRLDFFKTVGLLPNVFQSVDLDMPTLQQAHGFFVARLAVRIRTF
jgi:hypothetical protein